MVIQILSCPWKYASCRCFSDAFPQYIFIPFILKLQGSLPNGASSPSQKTSLASPKTYGGWWEVQWEKMANSGYPGANVVSLSGRFIERRPKGFVREVIVDKIRAITGIGYPSSPLKSKTPVFWSADWRTRRALCIGYFSGSSFGPSI